MMNILICGSSGFIGTHLSHYLNQIGHRIIGFDLVVPDNSSALLRFVQGDIRKKKELWPVLPHCDCVINLAAKHHDYGIEPNEYFQTNLEGTQCLLDGMAEFNIDQLVFYSSVAVYGNADIPRHEESDLKPDSPYGQSKMAAEQAIARWCEDSFIRTALIVRPALVFGPGNRANMFSLIRQIDRHQFVFFGSRQTTKGVCYVENLIAATAYMIDRLQPGVQVYNYVDSPSLTVEQMAEVIAEALQCSLPRIELPIWLGVFVGKLFDWVSVVTGQYFRVSAQRVRKLAHSTCYLANKILQQGFMPPCSLEYGLRQMVHWYRHPEQFQPASPRSDLVASADDSDSISSVSPRVVMKL